MWDTAVGLALATPKEKRGIIAVPYIQIKKRLKGTRKAIMHRWVQALQLLVSSLYRFGSPPSSDIVLRLSFKHQIVVIDTVNSSQNTLHQLLHV